MMDLKKVISMSGFPSGVKKKKETVKGINQVRKPLKNIIFMSKLPSIYFIGKQASVTQFSGFGS